MIAVWHPDWRERVKKHVRERGFDTVTAFADSQSTASTIELAAQLGEDVGADDVEKLLIDEAAKAGTIKRCAMSLLVRELNGKLPEGWQSEWPDEPGGSGGRLISACSSVACALPGRYRHAFDRVDEALWAAPIPPGWLPESPDDPILETLFRDYWDTADDPEVKAERQARWLAEHYEPMRQRARELGFDSITAYAESRPRNSLIDLARHLAGDSMQDREVARALVYEAEQAGTLERCARGILARALRSHLPQGWQLAWTTHPFGTGPKKFSAFEDLNHALHYRHEPTIEAIWNALDQRPMAEGWLPQGPDDPILVEVFARHWPGHVEDSDPG